MRSQDIIIIIVSLITFCDSINFRIINGTDARAGEFPFMVSLRNSRGVHFCGSTIISPVWALTAAHCVYGRNPKGLSIEYGSIDISPTSESIIYLSAIHVHENYDTVTHENDIALLKFSGFLYLNEHVQVIKLGSSELPADSLVTLIGWGQIKSTVGLSTTLQKVNMFCIEKKICSEIHFNPIFESNICIGVPGGGVGQCTGDSGGPLIFLGRQYGITSWSVKPCGFHPYPGVQTKVSHYLRWIERITGIRNLIDLEQIYS